MTAPPLLDLHDLGLAQTGNESWARGIAPALFELAGPRSYDIAVTSAAPAQDLASLPARSRVMVSASSARRLAWDLPRALRRGSNGCVLVQYTAPLTTVPVVVVVHDLSFEDPRAAQWLPLAARLRYRATVRASVRRAAHVVAVSEFTKRDIVRCYGVAPERVSVAPNAVDPAFAALLAQVPQRRAATPTVLVVGNVLPRKNLPVVARAVRLLRDRGSDVVLRVVGTVQPTGRRDAEEARRLLGDAVALTGYVTREQLALELRTAHVLAFPSLFEGFGIPVLEAMAAGLPVVVSDRTSLPEVVGQAGLVAPAEDVGAWAEALTRSLEPTTREAMVAAGISRVREFGWDRSASVVSGLLADAARRQPRRSTATD